MLSLGQKIRQRRLAKKMTQGQLAEGLVSASAISQIESDKINPSYKLLCQIAERLDVQLDYFLDTRERESYLEQTTSHKLAKTFLLANEPQNAVPILEMLLQSQEDNLEVKMDLATCYTKLNRSQEAIEMLESVMHQSLREDDKLSYVSSMSKLGHVFFQHNNMALALHYWHKAHEVIQELEDVDPFLHAEVATNLAMVYNHMGNFDRSLELFAESQKLVEGSSNLHHLATNYLGLGRSYYGKREFRLAEDYCQQAITIFKNLNQVRRSIQIKENFAILRSETGDHEGALHTLQECLQEYTEHGFESYTSNSHAEIAKLLIHLQDFQKAKQHITLAFQNCEPDSVYHAQCYYVRSLFNSAHDDIQSAIPDAQKAIEMFFHVEALQEYNKASLHLSDLYKRMDDYKSSTEVLEQSQIAIQNYLRGKGIYL
ncbi:helix-turn-helix domain-containing protein [Tumebacillus permanentifrigoris]|uniref:Tetratricopeptide repeat protein n=1 Tax=Tumebacillus permanentifrigoris TaxID=378543 RepID=A0A316DU80_9BACL|nr:tetratricopeptide repeat protein [Tumebacillus permanentifrigoris]PWK11583.1 tetratricopeptide repeat protein [Tumebacillus permanentifrigoris]